jgi:hypothetical protein
MLSRRTTIKGAAATAALLVCEAVAKPVVDALVPLQACGCPRIHETSYGHTCTVHDETGKRWDAYTIDDVAKECRVRFEPSDPEWSCYCGRHTNDEMPAGTLCVWERTSYECDEWECKCAESYRDGWLWAVTTDWIAMAKEGGLA